MDQIHIIRLTQKQFDALPEYSCSLPTGTTIGKRWKRNRTAYQRCVYGPLQAPQWVVGDYAEHPTEPDKLVSILWKTVIITNHP